LPATQQGERLAFGDVHTGRLKARAHRLVASSVHSEPATGRRGLNEPDAAARYGSPGSLAAVPWHWSHGHSNGRRADRTREATSRDERVISGAV
jgi:hypothetical protein